MDDRDLDRIAEQILERVEGGGPLPAHCSPLPSQLPGGTAERRNGGTPLPAPGSLLPEKDLASIIDHTNLKPEATRSDIYRLCGEAVEYGFFSVCVGGSWVEFCRDRLNGTDVRIVSVAGFPLGSDTSTMKAKQAAELVEIGADEVDMVAPIGRILDDDWYFVEDDIAAVVNAAGGRCVKVILETAVLCPTRIVKASAIAMEAGAQFVKTSTGLHPAGGASEEAVSLMNAAVGDRLGVKAAGGIRDRESALRMVAAGATRIGTSSGVQIVRTAD